jgi:hypothetical protein
MDLDLDPKLARVDIVACAYVARCGARGCLARATVIARKEDAAGRPIRQIELCDRRAEVIIEREGWR